VALNVRDAPGSVGVRSGQVPLVVHLERAVGGGESGLVPETGAALRISGG